MRRLATLVLALFVLASVSALAQGRRISSFPYTQNFSFVPGSVTSYAFPSTNVDGGEFTTSRFFYSGQLRTTNWVLGTNLTNHGLNNNHGNGGAIRLQTTGTTGPAGFIWHGDFTGHKAGYLTINWVKVPNSPSGSNPRYNELRIAVSSGSDLSFHDVAGVTWPRFYNTNTAESGTLRIKLPGSLDESSNARIQIYSTNLGGSFNHPRVTVDNLSITAGDCSTPGIATINGAFSPSTSRIALRITPAEFTDSVIVIARKGVPVSMRPMPDTRYAVGYTFPASSDFVAYFGPADDTLQIHGLDRDTLYYFNVYDAISCAGGIVYSAAASTSFRTLACASRPDPMSSVRDIIRTQTSLTFGITPGIRTDSLLVVRRLNIAPTFTPVAGVRYNVGQLLGNGQIVGYFGPFVDRLTISNLQPDSLYWFDVYGFQSCNATYSSLPGRDSARTLCVASIGNVTDVAALFSTKSTVGLWVNAAADVHDVVIFSMGPDTLRAAPIAGVLVSIGQVIGDDTVRYVGSSTRPVVAGLTHETTYRFYVIGINACSYSYSRSGDTVSATTLVDCVTGIVDTVENVSVVTNVPGTLRLKWSRTAGADRYLVIARTDSTPESRPVDYRFYQRGDSVGKSVVLARVTDTTATITGYQRNLALFVKVFGIIDCEMTYGVGSRVFPIATAGTDTSRRFPILGGHRDTLQFGGAILEFHQAPASDGSVLIVRRNGHPGSLGMPLQRNDDTIVNVLSADRWWQLSSNGLGSWLGRLRFDIAGLPGVSDTHDLEIVRRPAGGLWTDIRTDTFHVDSTSLWIDTKLQSFLGEYAIGAFYERNVLPVKLLSFEGFNSGERNILRWKTASEQNSAGFRVSRAGADGGEYSTIADYLSDPSLAGAGTSLHVRSYGLVDDDAALRVGGRYRYRLQQIDLDGSVEDLGTVEIDMDLRAERTVVVVMPNPVTSSTATLRFSSSAGATVEAVLLDATGARLRTLLSETSTDNAVRALTFDVSDLAAGTYFCRVESGGVRRVVPVVVIR